jgi:hypothetical protein
MLNGHGLRPWNHEVLERAKTQSSTFVTSCTSEYEGNIDNESVISMEIPRFVDGRLWSILARTKTNIHQGQVGSAFLNHEFRGFSKLATV